MLLLHQQYEISSTCTIIDKENEDEQSLIDVEALLHKLVITNSKIENLEKEVENTRKKSLVILHTESIMKYNSNTQPSPLEH